MFEWDEAKRRRTIEVRELDFADAIAIFDGSVLEVPSLRSGEQRIVAIGRLGDKHVAVVYTWRGTVRRIITVRAARSKERSAYDDRFESHQG